MLLEVYLIEKEYRRSCKMKEGAESLKRSEAVHKKRKVGTNFLKGTLRNLAMTREHHKIIFKPSPLAKMFLYTFFGLVVLSLWTLMHIQTEQGHHYVKKSRQQVHENIKMERKLKNKKNANGNRRQPRGQETDEIADLRRQLQKLEEENEKLKLRDDEL